MGGSLRLGLGRNFSGADSVTGTKYVQPRSHTHAARKEAFSPSDDSVWVPTGWESKGARIV